MVYSQPRYTPISTTGYNWTQPSRFSGGLHLPGGCGFPALKPFQWVGGGAVYVDTCNNRYYFWSGGAWQPLADTTATGVDSVNAVGVQSIADLRATAYQTFEARTKTSEDIPRVKILGYYAPGDGGGGDFYYCDTCTTTDDNGMFIKPTAVSGAGRWVRLYDPSQPVNVLWFGLVADGTTDNWARFQNMMTWLVSKKVNSDPDSPEYTYYAQLPPIYFPPNLNRYYFSRTMRFEYIITIIGGGSFLGNRSSKLYFEADSVGMIFAAPDQFTTGLGSGGSIIKNISIEGEQDGTFDTTAHGFVVRSPTYFENVNVKWFGGNGWDMTTNAGGNADFCRLIECQSNYNWNGIYVSGGESNVIKVTGGDYALNRKWCVYDIGFLGNIYEACHCANSGVVPGQKTYVIHEVDDTLRQYAARHDGFLKEPGVESGWEADWFYIGTSFFNGLAPDYNPLTYYWWGGSYYLETGVLDFCYSEGGILGSYIGNAAEARFGDHAAGFQTSSIGPNWFPNGNRMEMRDKGWKIVNSTTGDLTEMTDRRFTVKRGGDGLIVSYDSVYATGELKEMAGGSSYTKLITASTSGTHLFGRTTLDAGILYNMAGIYMGSIDNIEVARRMMFSNAVPSAGTWSAGDFVLDRTAALLGWKNTSGGTPGTWLPLYHPTGKMVDSAWKSNDSGYLNVRHFDGTIGQVYIRSSSGSTGLTVGTTTIASGTNGYVLMQSQAGGLLSQRSWFKTDSATRQVVIGAISAGTLGFSSNDVGLTVGHGIALKDGSDQLKGYIQMGDGLSGHSQMVLRNASVANTVILNTGGSSSFTGGNLGIGNSSPGALFTVGSSDDFSVNSAGKISEYANAAPTNGQLLIGHTSNGTFEKATLASANGSVSITNGAGTIDLATSQTLASGEYTPTETDIANVAASTPNLATWTRVGDYITVAGSISLTATSPSTLTTVDISLPVASSLSSSFQLNGTIGTDAVFGYIYGNSTDDRARISFISPATGGPGDVRFIFMYKVIN